MLKGTVFSGRKRQTFLLDGTVGDGKGGPVAVSGRSSGTQFHPPGCSLHLCLMPAQSKACWKQGLCTPRVPILKRALFSLLKSGCEGGEEGKCDGRIKNTPALRHAWFYELAI